MIIIVQHLCPQPGTERTRKSKQIATAGEGHSKYVSSKEGFHCVCRTGGSGSDLPQTS